MSTELIKIEPIVQLIQSSLPRMIKGRDNAVAAMKEITEITSDEQLEEANQTLVAVRNTYDGVSGLRKAITAPVDELKKQLMQYESDLDPNKENEVSRIRKMIGTYNQKKIDEKKAEEEKAAKIKAVENYKVDIVTEIKTKLSNLLVDRVAQVQSGSRDYFAKATLEDFDEKATTFKNMKPKLKEETYLACFPTTWNEALLDKRGFTIVVEQTKLDEPYTKWNELVAAKIAPVLNEWVGKIPELKQQLIDLKNASDENERQRIAAEQKKKADEAQAKRDQELAKLKEQQESAIQQQADVNKLQNDFREQAMTQDLGDTGATKLILRFLDEKPVQPLCEIIYQCFMNAKFGTIVKRDNKGNAKQDEHGFPEYIDGVDHWVQFFLKNCDVNIKGVEIKQVSKVIVRK